MAKRGGPPRWGWEPGDRGDWGAYDGNFPAYVDAAERKRRAQQALARLAKVLRREPRPVPPSEGRAIAKTFWGKAWCENLERYSDFATRLPRGRSYVREGAVIDLLITAGRIEARVAGTDVYEIVVTCTPVAATAWKAIRATAGGKIDSLVALLGGSLPEELLERVTQRDGGLFPTPREITFTCSCPDSARMCKHIAAVLYGIGIRLDAEPALLFTLRGVDPNEMVSTDSVDLFTLRPPSKRVLDGASLSGIFGVDLLKEDAAAYRKRPKVRRVTRKKKKTPGRNPARKR